MQRLRLERALSAFRPMLIGPHAVGMAQDGDVVEVRCHAPNMDRFHTRLSAMYRTLPGFTLTDTGCRLALQVPVHIVGAPKPVRAQEPARRHLLLVRLMRSLGPRFTKHLKGRRRQDTSPVEIAAEIMGVKDILELEGANLVSLRDRWRSSQNPRPPRPPPPPTPPPAATAEPPPPSPAPVVAVPAAEPDEESLLRQPSALLMRRDSRWVNAALVLGRRGRSGMELAKPPKREK